MIRYLVLLAGWFGSGSGAGSNPARDSVWYALPPGFDQSKPDSILGLVEQAPLWFDGIYLFGDSDCDTGNLFKLTKNTDPDPKAYWNGRFSNGPMWPDYLQARHKLNVRNYAYGGRSWIARTPWCWMCLTSKSSWQPTRHPLPLTARSPWCLFNSLGTTCSTRRLRLNSWQARSEPCCKRSSMLGS
ncbi:hypothetical protein DSO57_1031692 [Entomophthora muscae]|uniref:Uncharacterized protein n=1 Tax=Entomophthora muscae TaxID=34485 RepID=A0ACC2UAZ7_9FUNG|nr:hypothetical protein DSO57_1031692 [Entomophthora muscae]